MRTWTIALACLVLAACGTPATRLELAPDAQAIAPGGPGYEQVLQVAYLGAGGLLLQRGDDVIVMAPFMSNPSMGRVAFTDVSPHRGRIDRWMKPVAPSFARAQAILAGHSHYDHLMDLTYIVPHYASQATVYGNETMAYQLAPAPLLRTKNVEGDAGDSTSVGRWTKVSDRIRFMPLRSEHAAILDHFFWAPGDVTAPLTTLPKRAWDWKAGHTLAYLIDFMSADGQRVDFRVHYQDAASNPPLGYPPLFSGPDDHAVDVAFLCVPGYDLVHHYPQGIVDRLRPRFVAGIHWETFFQPLPDKADDLWTLPTVDVPAFKAAVEGTSSHPTFLLPAPGRWLHFPPLPAP